MSLFYPALVAFAPYAYDAELLNLPAARSLIERAGREAPVVVVYMHAGAEGSAADHVTGREEDYPAATWTRARSCT